jgi:hypothetical protein
VLVVSSDADEAIGPESDILSMTISINKGDEDGLGLIRGFLALKDMRAQSYLGISEAAQIYRCRGSMGNHDGNGDSVELNAPYRGTIEAHGLPHGQGHASAQRQSTGNKSITLATDNRRVLTGSSFASLGRDSPLALRSTTPKSENVS